MTIIFFTFYLIFLIFLVFFYLKYKRESKESKNIAKSLQDKNIEYNLLCQQIYKKDQEIIEFHTRIEKLLATKDQEIRAARESSNKIQKAVIKGFVNEQIAPFLPNFPWKPSDLKFLGNPIDFLCFSGISEEDIKEIILIDIKTGDAVLNKRQRQIKKCIETGAIKFETFRIE